MKTVYCLRIRPDDKSAWSEPSYYRTRRRRDADASLNRCMAGMRTHSYEEKLTAEQIEQLDIE